MQHTKTRIIFITLIVGFGLLTPILNSLWNRVPSVPPAEAAKALLRDPGKNLLIDIRKDNIYGSTLIAGAIREPDVGNLKPELLRSKDKVFLICNTGFTGSRAVRVLRSRGHGNVYNVEGGAEAWIGGKQAVGKVRSCLRPLPTPLDTPAMAVRRNDLTRLEQFVVCFTSFGLKPLYEVVALIIAIVIWKWPEPHWRTLRWGMLAFFLGENACAINYLFYGLENFTWEFWHCYGMLVAFGLVFYALIGFVDQQLIHYSEVDKSCAFVGLCKSCYKHKPVACNLWIIFLFAIPAIVLVCFMPLSASFKNFTSIGTVYGDDVLFTHSIMQQLYETRIYPVIAILFLAAGWGLLIAGREAAFQSAKIFFSAGLGVIGFSIMRFVLFWSYSENILWAESWEEITEFLFVAAVVVILCARRINPLLRRRSG